MYYKFFNFSLSAFIALVFTAMSFGQVVFTDDFEAYTVGGQLACQDSINWTTWNQNPCDSIQDAYISDNYAYSGTNSFVIVLNNDLVKPLGTQTSSKWDISFMVYLPAGKEGYFNCMAEFFGTPDKWALDAFFEPGGSGRLNAGGENAATFTYAYDTWQSVEVIVDLNNDIGEFWFDRDSVHTWQWTLGYNGAGCPLQLDAVNFWGPNANGEMYFDDFVFIDLQPEPELSLIYPNGGEQYAPNDTVHIQWQHSLINFITLEFSDDNGATWSDIDMGFPADSNLYIWTIEPGVSSTQCLIKICDFENSQFCDESDSVFTVTPPSSITVLIPNGGEVWPWGSTQDITWSSINVTDVKIELSLNNGATWTTIIDSTLSNGIYSWLVNPPQPSTQALIKISDVSDETIVDQSDDVFTIDIAPGVEAEFSGIPDSYKLLQNYPNPFNPSTTIYYGLPEEGSVKITIYDVLGGEVMIISEEKKEAGYHRLEFNATDLPSGIYFYKLQAGNFIQTKKMILLR